MDTLTLVIILAALALAVVLGGGLAPRCAAAAAGRGRARRPLPPLTDLEERPGERAAEPSGDVDGRSPPDAGAPTAPDLETPEPVAGRLARLRSRLGRLADDARPRPARPAVAASGSTTRPGRRSRTSCSPRTSASARPRSSSSGCAPGSRSSGPATPETVRGLLREELLTLVGPDVDRSLHTTGRGRPPGRRPRRRRQRHRQDHDRRQARAGAGRRRTGPCCSAPPTPSGPPRPTSCTTWGERVGAPIVRGPEGGDPASVAFDAVKQGDAGGYDVVLVDTAGRLQNKVGLMDELGKVKRVVEKQGPVDEVLLVLDATTGQNGLVQARVFAEVVDITGIVLTKLDGTAKGGIVVAVQRELGVPVKLVGLGEGADDLAPFDPEAFVDALLGDPAESDLCTAGRCTKAAGEARWSHGGTAHPR